jgi:CheY-like chemotaxis protein
MVEVRLHSDGSAPARFNVLLTQDRAYPDEHWTSVLPRLLQPQGIVAYIARSGREAMDLAGHLEIHAAVIDLARPLDEAAEKAAAQEAGLRLLELFHRLPNRPPMVVVHRPAYNREADRLLREALRLGAFSVLHKPVELEQVLAVFRRLLDRQYHGNWPVQDRNSPNQPNPPRRPGPPPPSGN